MIRLPTLFFLVLCCASVSAADWPQWRGPFRTGYVPADEPVPETLPDQPRIVWHRPIGEGFASPVVAGGKVFYMDNQNAQETAHAADAATGQDLWSTTIFSSHRDGFGIGPRCAPTVDGSRVFVQSCKGEFQCLNVADGKMIWHTNFVTDFGAIYIGEKGKASGASRHGANGAPIVDGEHVIVQVGSANGASIVAFNKADGKVVWKSQNDQTAYAPPIIGSIGGVRQVLSFTAEALIGLDPADGRLLWRMPLKT
ncbi:MAG TPA: PQQ-binding-like beta-propeller repeat protein, partial [Chthoniobacteraceae bacterium]